MSHAHSRRHFLRSISAAGAGALLGTTAQASLPKYTFSSTIHAGFIGMGGMGRAHFDRLAGHAGLRLTAVADPDADRCQAAREFATNRLQPVAAYGDYREMLYEHPELDVVFIATPDHWHARAALESMRAGKDVYCEKPLARTIQEGRDVVEAARRHGRVLQVGLQQRSQPHFRHACELVRNGRIGEVRRVVCFFGPNPYARPVPDEAAPAHLDWARYLGPAPKRSYNPLIHPYNFRYFRAFSGGLITDWGVHVLDIAQWALDKDRTSPGRIEAEGGYDSENAFDMPRWMHVRYDYGDVTVEWRQGMGEEIEPGQAYGTKFYGTDGELCVNRAGYWGRRKGGRPLDETLDQRAVRLRVSTNHYEDFFAGVRNRTAPICDAETGHRSSVLAHLGNVALDAGRPLVYDPDAESFPGDGVANALLKG